MYIPNQVFPQWIKGNYVQANKLGHVDSIFLHLFYEMTVTSIIQTSLLHYLSLTDRYLPFELYFFFCQICLHLKESFVKEKHIFDYLFKNSNVHAAWLWSFIGVSKPEAKDSAKLECLWSDCMNLDNYIWSQCAKSWKGQSWNCRMHILCFMSFSLIPACKTWAKANH